MAIYSVVMFSYSTHTSIKNYLDTDTLPAIQKEFDKITVESVDETDSRLELYLTEPYRLPLYLTFKNGIVKNVKKGKMTTNQTLDWLSSCIVNK